MFFYIEKILRAKKPKYIILENVRNLVSHDNGNTWKVIRQHIIDCGYRITENPIIISPHQLGIPQLRERVVILGVYDPDNTDKYLNIDLGTMKDKKDNSIESILEQNNNKVMLLAPTGRASKKLSESTGREAKTIHRGLEINFKGNVSGFVYN